ncbi:MAG: hypothetical protein U0930_05570 [Pirellulales bacterium]
MLRPSECGLWAVLEVAERDFGNAVRFDTQLEKSIKATENTEVVSNCISRWTSLFSIYSLDIILSHYEIAPAASGFVTRECFRAKGCG